MPLLLGLATLLLCGAFQGGKLVKTRIGKAVTMLVPADFMEMSTQDASRLAQSYRKSMAQYTSADRTVTLSVNRSFSRWGEGDIGMVKDFYKASLLQLFDDTDFVRETVETINGRQFAVFEFTSTIKDTGEEVIRRKSDVRKYNYIQYTIVDNNNMVFSFSAPANGSGVWQKQVRQIMQSVRVD